MKTQLLYFFTLILSFNILYGQSNQEKAKELGYEAVIIMDKGNIQKSIELLEEAQKLDPENYLYPYEIAVAYTRNKEYKKSLAILEDVIKRPNIEALVYQLMGNNYSLLGDRESAIKTYEKGLEYFPNAGGLYLERGTVEALQKNYEEALTFYEKGIEVDPDFPSNYFKAAVIYFNSNTPNWGIIYGEIFMNLERGSSRTEEMSYWLYIAYEEKIQVDDESVTLSLTNFAGTKKGDDIEVDPIVAYHKAFEFSLGLVGATEVVKTKKSKRRIDLAMLHRIRRSFLETFAEVDTFQVPNPILDYQRKVQKIGHLEAYNYWVLSQGDMDSFEDWLRKNEKKFDAFIEWFAENPLEMTTENVFSPSKL